MSLIFMGSFVSHSLLNLLLKDKGSLQSTRPDFLQCTRVSEMKTWMVLAHSMPPHFSKTLLFLKFPGADTLYNFRLQMSEWCSFHHWLNRSSLTMYCVRHSAQPGGARVNKNVVPNSNTCVLVEEPNVNQTGTQMLSGSTDNNYSIISVCQSPKGKTHLVRAGERAP